MNYLMKGKRSPKLSFDFNLKPKKNQIFFSTLVFRSKLIIKNDRKLSPTLKKIQANKNHILIKNYPKENKSNEDFDINDDKSTSNLTSTLISNEQNILKQNFTNHIITENNFDINISNKKRKIVNSLTNSLTRNDKTVNTISNNDNNNNIKEIRRRYRHKQVKREICMSTTNNNPNNKMKDNKLENNNNKLIDHKLNPREYKNKSITIPINKKISDNILINQKQDKSFLDYFLLKNKMHKKTIKSNNIIENYKENKENIEINDNKSIYFIKRSKVNSKVKRIKFPPSNKIYNSKTNSKSKYINNGKKIIGNKYYKITLKEIKKKENEMKENNDIYFNENDLNENILSIKTEKNIEQNNRDSIINKVLHFKTECNGIFNQIKSNNKNNANNNSNLNEIQGNKKLKEKKESINSIINNENDKNNKEINIEENGDIKNIENIIKNNLDYNLNKRKFIMRKNDDNYLYQKLQKYNTHSTLNNDLILKTKIDSIIQKEKDESSINIKKDSSIPDNIDKQNSLTLNRDLMFTKKRFKSISLNLNKQPKKPQHLNNKNILYEIIENNKILQILYSFCEFDNNLLNKFCLLSKNIYKKIKPLIYQRISSIIFKYNENNNTKNKIKKYLMKNNSSLMKLSSTILHKKYTDLIFENNNKYDVDIRKDLTRTFPDNILFKYGNTYYNKLYHILTAYSNFNKNIGYIQGLNFLAANIIYFFEDEIDEFVFLDAIIHKFDFNKILDKNLNNNFFVKKLEKINLLLMKKLPKLNKFLSNIKLNFDFFITNWILTLFSDSIDTEYLTIIWDFMGIFGWKFFEYFVLNVFILCENSILNSTQNNLTYIKKNIFRNENFKKNFNNLIKDTVHSLINDEIII